VADAAVAELAAFIHQQRRVAAGAWRRSDLSMTHLHLLMVLDSEGPLPMTRVAETLVCSLPNATGMIDRMEERGLIERSRDDRDRRVVRVSVTDAGRQVVGEHESMRQNQVRPLLESMPIADQRTCLRAFRCMRRAAERLDPTGTPPRDSRAARAARPS
jgi:DNA-binding MarR family transcriptional regulator